MDVVNPVKVVIYDAAKRLGGPDLINAVVTLQQPRACVRGDYCKISVSAFVGWRCLDNCEEESFLKSVSDKNKP